MRLQSTDPYQQPFLDYNYLKEESDRVRLRDSVRLCMQLSEHPEFQTLIQECIEPPADALASDDALDAWIAREVTTSQHISGTCKMGPDSDPMAVVDQFGKVKGITNLRVADASVMPDCIRANTNVTSMTIGERVAEFIKEGR
jgi:choline dehydrogenase-like flavoprotein